ncbi:type I restriction endonuclease [Alistipes putredinis]|uniref:type I restriction endonuclease n=1 Tax=Alistipes putredinis TaxID=28117 RepID=UPI0040275E15
MDFKDELLILAERVGKLKDNVKTEEATKTSFVLPFLQALGYDIFNPEEVTPECICDYGTKKGEKIDYTVCMDGEPIMLIECKHWSADLSKYKAQLFRYYHVSQAKFGVLTNGINYQFYTDLDTPNKMDDKPFFEIDMLNLKDSHIEKLKQFRHDQYNTYMILNSATEMKYINALRSLIVKESSNPSDLFVKFMTKQVYDGVVTKNIIDEFRPMIQRAFQQYTNDYINERLKSAITPDVPSVEVSSNVSTEKSVANEEDMQDGNKIVTTDEELMGFYIVRAILCNTVDLDRVVDRSHISLSFSMITIESLFVACISTEGKSMLKRLTRKRKEQNI